MAEETLKDQLLQAGEDRGVALAQLDLSQDLTPDDPAFEVSKKRAAIQDQQILDFKNNFDVRGARRSGYSDAELIQYGIDNYPGGYDYQGARAAGYSDDDILEDMFNVRAGLTKTEAFVEGVKRGAVQSIPVIAGAASGAVTGFGVFGPLGIIPGMIIGGASGIPAGSQLDQYLFDQTPLKPSLNVPFEGGLTVGSGLPGMLSPSAAALRFGPGAISYQNNITALMGRITPGEKVLQTLKEAPLRSAYLEGSALLSSAQGAMLAEGYFPGDPLVRASGEIVFGAANPTGIVNFIAESAIVRGVNLFRKFFSEQGRKTQQANLFYEFFEDPKTPGGGPGTTKRILQALQQYTEVDGEQLTGLQQLAKAYGLDVNDYKPTPATITKEPALINLTKNLAAQNKDLGPTIAKAMEQDYLTVAKFVTLLKNTGDPALIALAANSEKALMSGIITNRLDNANLNATRANKNLLPKTEEGVPNPRAGVVASLNIANVTEQALKDVRAREKELYNLIDKKDEMSVDEFLEAYKDMQEELLDYQVNIPLPVKALIAKAQGESLEAADELSASLANVTNKISKSQSTINDVRAIDSNAVDFVNTIIDEGNYDSFAFENVKGSKIDGQVIDDVELQMTRESLVNENYDNKNAIKFDEIVELAKEDGALESSLRQYLEEFDDVFSGKTSSKGTFTATNKAGLALRPEDFTDLSYFKKISTKEFELEDSKFDRLGKNLKELYANMRADEGDRGLIQEQINFMKRLFTAHKKAVQDIKNYGKTNKKYFDPKQASRGTLEKIRKLTDEEFDALNPNEKLEQQLMEIQDIISDFEEPKDTNIGFTEFDFSPPKIARIKTILKEKAKIINNTLELDKLRAARPVDLTAEEGIITVGDAMNARSILLNAARKHIADSEFQEAHFLSDLADGLKKDFGIKSGGEEELTATSAAALTDNQLALRTAFNFSKSLNDVFNRAFPNAVLGTKRSGERQIMPELLSASVFRGGGDALSVRYDQLDNAITFLADKEGLEFDKTLTSKLGTLHAAQEDLLRVAADKLIDPTTGRITIEKLDDFKKEYRTVLFNQDGTARFPDFISDLSTVEKAENALSLMLTRTGDPRRAETGVSPLGKVAKSGTYQARLKNMISFQDFAKKDANIGKLVGTVLGSPDNRPKDGSKALKHLITRVVRADAGKYPGAKNGLRDVIFEKAIAYATGKTDPKGEKKFNFYKLQEFLTKPMNVKDLSPLELMRQNGLIDEGFAVRLNTLINEGIAVQKNFKGISDFEKVKLPEPLSGRAFRLLVRLGFLRAGRFATRRFPGQGQGLAEPAIAAQEGVEALVDVPDMAVTHLMFAAAADANLFKEMMDLANTSIKKIERSRRLNTYLFNAGYISAKSYNENKEKAKKRQQNVPVPVDQPEVIGRETKPVTPSLVRPDVIQTSQAPITASPTNIAAVSPSLNNIAPPVQNQRVDRRRFAALFPEDADLVQGIGSLRG